MPLVRMPGPSQPDAVSFSSFRPVRGPDGELPRIHMTTKKPGELTPEEAKFAYDLIQYVTESLP